ncbi:hypothetical protein UFOVP1_19 [uncultured Caudovirales phage]|uniref:Uncharacterized protein n=1 Tax=uncultured Caudovirales phage TaxID=2100421 RepID=A0A6J5KKZ4_9CAUD|nr:hypothetical protein UFOVP1_19 [uncultured Caudovirales phage]
MIKFIFIFMLLMGLLEVTNHTMRIIVCSKTDPLLCTVAKVPTVQDLIT